jgi:intraflagellar transport protein 140
MYMQNTKDPNLLKWWAQYIESTGDMEAAFKVYQTAEDWFSQVSKNIGKSFNFHYDH